MKALLAAVLTAALVAGCQSSGSSTTAESAQPIAKARAALAPGRNTCRAQRLAASAGLAGRTLAVSRPSDIVLEDREVVLTFDDGPIPRKTMSILDTLDDYGAKATFFMVGRMARSYPKLVRAVAARGHSIGSHTQNHPDLTRLSRKSAMAEVAQGERAIAAALAGSGQSAAPFFRFPYLAESKALRAAMAKRGVAVIGVDIDSNDYHRVTPARVKAYTMKRLRAKGRGIILFHDIHARTATMLPSSLAALKAEGYKVVHLVPPGTPVPCPTLSF